MFTILLIGLRMIWNSNMLQNDAPQVEKGVIDLRNWEGISNETVKLNGEWEFFPNQFLQGDGSGGRLIKDQGREWVSVPGNWGKSNSLSNNHGYGTYRLTMLMHPSGLDEYSLRMNNIAESSAVYVNGELVGKSGEPAITKQTYKPMNFPYTVSFRTEIDQVEILIQVTNYNHYQGGILSSIEFGTDMSILQKENIFIGLQLLVCIIMLIHGLYTLILYLIGGRQAALLAFSLLILSAILSLIVDDDKLLFAWFQQSYDWKVKLHYLSFLMVGVCLLNFIRLLYLDYWKRRTIYIVNVLGGLLIVFTVVLPLPIVQRFGSINYVMLFIPMMMALRQTYMMAIRGEVASSYLLLALVALQHNSTWGLFKNTFWHELGFYPGDKIIAFLLFAAFWFKRYIWMNRQTVLFAERLQQADKQKDDFLANTSHELRNPLHSMLNIAQHLLDMEKQSGTKRSEESLEMLVSVGRRMSLTVNDLLDFSQMKESNVRLELAPLSLHQVVSGVMDLLRYMTDGKTIRFKNHIPNLFPELRADENRLIQILFNLLHNAVKHTNDGSITIDAAVKGKYANIRVMDTGQGMDEQLQKRIFLPYEQGDSSITANGGGIGLGLSISKQLVELHGGTIDVQSVPGQGSVFTFSIPLSDVSSIEQDQLVVADEYLLVEDQAAATEYASSTVPLMQKGSHSSNHRMQIMLIDDDPTNLYVIKDVLSSDRYAITIAHHAQEALELLGTRSWNLIISDVMMPFMSGYELTVRIRKRFSRSELPIILLTARNRPEAIEAGFKAGANDYVTKPVELKELRARVRALMDLQESVHKSMRMEAAWLQAQMKPHFIFNTLNTITSLSSIDPDRMVELLHAFASYLRASFDFQNAGELVPISHELELVQAYLYIEKERFCERLLVIWEVEDDLETYIPPLSIQTLVENALRHGILNRPEGGTVRISIKHEGEDVVILIEDDGVGMSEERVQQLSSEQRDGAIGIGVWNTDRRLKQAYGTGLCIQSEEGKGTTISFRMSTAIRSKSPLL